MPEVAGFFACSQADVISIVRREARAKTSLIKMIAPEEGSNKFYDT